MLSHSIRDVMILPYGLKRFSRSCCAMFFGKPLTYRFAPLIASLLGLAYDTWTECRQSMHAESLRGTMAKRRCLMPLVERGVTKRKKTRAR
jgi:hypothetical protein